MVNTDLVITYASPWRAEVAYVCSVIFKEWLGLTYRLEHNPEVGNHFEITTANGAGLVLPNDLLSRELLIDASSLPEGSRLQSLDHLGNAFYRPQVPVIYGFPVERAGVHTCDIDLLGSIFFFITRLEELIVEEKDAHNRFRTQASWAYKNELLDRPIVNEYVEILWALLKQLDPSLERKKRTYTVALSHDVDHPFLKEASAFANIKKLAGDILSRGDVALARKRMAAVGGAISDDAYYTFDYLMDTSEKYNLVSHFNFMATPGVSGLDGGYELEDEHIVSAIKNIHDRGHVVGIHPSYHSFKDARQFQEEVTRFRKFLEKNNISQSEIGGRQHYLRWENPTTWQLWEDAGLQYDSTLSWGNFTGFRSGVCYPYSVFNVVERKHLSLVEHPLIFMDVNAWRADKNPLELLKQYVETVRFFGGTMTILYHNNYLVSQQQKTAYEEWLEVAVG